MLGKALNGEGDVVFHTISTSFKLTNKTKEKNDNKKNYTKQIYTLQLQISKRNIQYTASRSYQNSIVSNNLSTLLHHQ